jgi:hypothetical protein
MTTSILNFSTDNVPSMDSSREIEEYDLDISSFNATALESEEGLMISRKFFNALNRSSEIFNSKYGNFPFTVVLAKSELNIEKPSSSFIFILGIIEILVEMFSWKDVIKTRH